MERHAPLELADNVEGGFVSAVRRRSPRSLLVLAAIALAALAVVAATSVGGTTYPARISVGIAGSAFHGVVRSESDFCTSERRVRVFRQRPGPDSLRGRTRTTAAGRWRVRVKNLSVGTYYAKAPVYGSASLGIDCRAARSRLITLD